MRLTLLNEMKIDKKKLLTLWYENEKGEKFVPDMAVEGHPMDQVPDGFVYQHSQFPGYLRHNCYKSIIPEEVESCDHPDDFRKIDHGLIEGYEGHTCDKCGGYQSKNCGEEWPKEWDANGSRDVFSGESGWSEDLVLAMANSDDFTLSEAILASANSCERCMNSLSYKYGLDWGYEEGCKEWSECNTSCDFCT